MQALRLPTMLGVGVVAAQIAYPLSPVGPARDRLTVATVLLFAAASLSHAAVTRGRTFAGVLLVVTAGGGLAVEALGVATGLPFGAYDYTGTLGWSLLGVPVVIPLAWTMMAYPSLLVGRRITAAVPAGPIVAGLALASWDLFLDPQMVDAGHWRWAGGGPQVLGIPLSNFVGWALVAMVMMALLWPAAAAAEGARTRPPNDRVPYGLWLWTYGSSVLAHLAFFGLPGSALLGGLGMGMFVAAFVRAVRRPA